MVTIKENFCTLTYLVGIQIKYLSKAIPVNIHKFWCKNNKKYVLIRGTPVIWSSAYQYSGFLEGQPKGQSGLSISLFHEHSSI